MVYKSSIIIFSCSLLHVGVALASTDASSSTDHVARASFEEAAPVAQPVYAREPEPEPEPEPEDYAEIHARDEYNDGLYARHAGDDHDETHRQRRAAIDYIMALAARGDDSSTYHSARDINDESHDRRAYIEQLLQLAAREPSYDGSYDYLASRDLETELEARGAIGMALRPIAQQLGKAIREGLFNKPKRELQEELEARGAIGMALRPIAKELGKAIREGLFNKNKRDVQEDLEARGAIGMALRPIAKELGKAIREGLFHRRDVDEELQARAATAVSMALRPVLRGGIVLLERAIAEELEARSPDDESYAHS